mmetsp:Transcript_89720/g.155282  ORF Transcript_89720/g.155282 Transcript_89720/m.155282 type:complete len:283 (-) Transcript_89720:48-896(-)
MRLIALVLALACTSHGRRVQSAMQGHEMATKHALARLLTASTPASGFQPADVSAQSLHSRPAMTARPHVRMQATAELYDLKERDSKYGSPLNVAQYLVDLHDNKGTFDFCGGMMFQLVLSEKLRNHLSQVAESGGDQPVVFDASKDRMAKIPGYSQTANVDSIKVFHGREIRQVSDAAGGMGMVLQLSHPEEDPEGWTEAEVKGYDGWGHDSGRVWRKGDRLESEGFKTFRNKFGQRAFTLHHRFYLHFDGFNRLWLSAEDGCEGYPASAPAKFNVGPFSFR